MSHYFDGKCSPICRLEKSEVNYQVLVGLNPPLPCQKLEAQEKPSEKCGCRRNKQVSVIVK